MVAWLQTQLMQHDKSTAVGSLSLGPRAKRQCCPLQGLVVPRWFYYWAQAERKHPSFTALEKRMLILFFYWAVRRATITMTLPQTYLSSAPIVDQNVS